MGKIHFHQEMQNNITTKIINKMSKQTAIKWLLENINSEPHSEEDFKYNEKCWDKAEEMEKEQIMNSWVNGVISDNNMTAEDYYNKTFKN